MVKTLEANIETLGCEDRVEVACCDALGPATLSRCPKPAHIVFMDPPYPMVRDEEDWPRVKKQFERLIEMLDETGYAIIRTPWPFYHRELIEDEEVVEGDGGSESTEAAVEKTEMIEGESMVEIDLDGDWEKEWIAETVEEKDGGEPNYRTWDISLEMEGADGPETHVYGSTAIHLYMRKSAQ